MCKRTNLTIIFSILWLSITVPDCVAAERPSILVTSGERGAMREKIEQADWAHSAYLKIKGEIDGYTEKMQAEPDWLVSRLAMNWDTHYTTPITEKQKTIGGEGRAPVPTPRFAGQRDWATDYSRQSSVENLVPYNDHDGQIQLINKKTGKSEWTDVAKTGHNIESINRELMNIAAKAGFLYWITGDKKYARVGAPILWTYMNGLQHVQPPRVPEDEDGTRKIISVTSYEVIHEQIVVDMAVAYDFLHGYITEHKDMDGRVIEQGLKRIAQRVALGGFSEGNWNLNQAMMIAYGGLALDNDDAYEDGKGRQHYVDLVLNAKMPTQLGLVHVIKAGYDQETALWPEAPGYGFGTTSQLIELASLMSNDPAGARVLNDPLLTRAILAQTDLLYPKGWSIGLGDTYYTRLNTKAAELMISWAARQGDNETIDILAGALHREIDFGHYSRNSIQDLVGLTRFLTKLPEHTGSTHEQTPTYFGKPLNVVMLRNMPPNGDPNHAIAAAMYGTRGGHVHSNGLAIELFGAGYVLGVDPGRGVSYWQPEHSQYYDSAPAHNTVVVNGQSDYPAHGDRGVVEMTVKKVQPAFGEPADGSGLVYAQGGMVYEKPRAVQKRTLALVRVDDKTAFIFDLFQSKRTEPDPKQYHDYFYHNMGSVVRLTDTEGSPLDLEPSSQLTSAAGNLKAYDYFSNEKSLPYSETFHASIPLALPAGGVTMDVWMLGGKDRTVYTVDAPTNRAARDYISRGVWDKPTPTFVVRQQGEAWKRPFVAVYEPCHDNENASIRAVESEGEDNWIVQGDGWSVRLTLQGSKLTHQIINNRNR